MKIVRMLTLVIFGSIYTVSASAAPVVGQKAPDFIGTTSKGLQLKLSDLKGKPVVLEWTNHLCPYVKKHYSSGNMQRTQRALTEEGAVWISIVSSAPGLQGHVTGEQADTLSASRGTYADHVILDPEGTIGRLYGARTTPHMFLINDAGDLEYMGAIDDRPSAQAASLEGALNYVVAAWTAVKDGNKVQIPATKPYGCSVKYGS